jgi:hypothetical protein
MRLWQARLAKKASSVLASDEDDDLFFAGGKHRSAFLQALVGAACSRLGVSSFMHPRRRQCRLLSASANHHKLCPALSAC